MHQPTHKFLESHDIVFDEGGPILCHECIILKPDNTPSLLNLIPPTTSPATAPTPSTTLTFIPSIPSTSSHPKRTTHLSVPDVDLYYSISSYAIMLMLPMLRLPSQRHMTKPWQVQTLVSG